MDLHFSIVINSVWEQTAANHASHLNGVLRVGLGLVTLVSGVGKLLDPAGSRQAMSDFGVPSKYVVSATKALPIVELSTHVRTGPAQWWAEIVASFGLVGFILGGLRFAPTTIPWLVGLYITSAYWFTASTSFANPAVAVARAFTESFSGIRLADVPAFVAAQFVGAFLAFILFEWLFNPGQRRTIRGAMLKAEETALD